MLEDAAQAAGAKLGGVMAGALGDAATFSFFPSKNLPCLGDGGAVVTDDDDVAKLARRLRFHGSDDKQTFVEVGYNSRLDEIQAAALRVLLPELDGWNAARREAAVAYEREGLGEHVELPEPVDGAEHVLPPVRGPPPARGRAGGRAERGRRRRARLLPRAGAPPARDGALRHRDRGSAGHRGGGPDGPGAAHGHGAARRRGGRGGGGVRVWVDLTNSPHVLVMRPVIDAMRAQGHEVEVTARDFAQTLELCDRFGIEHTAVGRHRGGKLASKGLGLASRSTALARWARPRRFDVAMGHGSNDVTVAAALLRDPQRHGVRLRVGHGPAQRELPAGRRRWWCPTRSRPSAWTATAPRARCARYPGLKEEYYLADFEADRAVLDELGLDDSQPIAVVRTPPAVSLYHRFENPLFARVLDRLAAAAQTVVLPRTAEQRAELEGREGLIVPEHAIDAQSLIAFSDLVVSAGGTMNREAVALGAPVFTTFEGRLGAVDERLLDEGRLRRLEDPDEVQVTKRAKHDGNRIRRDPADLAKLLLSAREQ